MIYRLWDIAKSSFENRIEVNGFVSTNPQTHILNRYTGYRDKNNKDIYEDDFCKILYKNQIVKILYYCHAFDAYKVNEKGVWLPYCANYNSLSNPDIIFEVIGNAHENNKL